MSQPAAGQRMNEAYARLRELIVWGRLAPGTRIIERDLAQRLDISRTPLRGALQRLQQEGYVTSGGTGRQSRLSVSPLTIQDARELFAIVATVEGLAGRFAALLPSVERGEIVDRLVLLNTDLLRAGVDDRPDSPWIFELDRDFHRTYVEGAAGPRLLALHDAIKPQAERYNRLYTQALVSEIRTSVLEHDAIIRGIDEGDPDRAEQAIRTNFLNAAERLGGIIASLGERGSW